MSNIHALFHRLSQISFSTKTCVVYIPSISIKFTTHLFQAWKVSLFVFNFCPQNLLSDSIFYTKVRFKIQLSLKVPNSYSPCTKVCVFQLRKMYVFLHAKHLSQKFDQESDCHTTWKVSWFFKKILIFLLNFLQVEKRPWKSDLESRFFNRLRKFECFEKICYNFCHVLWYFFYVWNLFT